MTDKPLTEVDALALAHDLHRFRGLETVPNPARVSPPMISRRTAIELLDASPFAYLLAAADLMEISATSGTWFVVTVVETREVQVYVNASDAAAAEDAAGELDLDGFSDNVDKHATARRYVDEIRQPWIREGWLDVTGTWHSPAATQRGAA